MSNCYPEYKCGGGKSGGDFGLKQANDSNMNVMRAEASGQSWGPRAHWELVGHGGRGDGRALQAEALRKGWCGAGGSSLWLSMAGAAGAGDGGKSRFLVSSATVCK